MSILIEVCVDDAAGLAEAIAHGADRIELCSALSLGGLTPSAGLMALAATAPVPVYAMIRPRAGDFCWSEAEITVMKADIEAARAAGLAGVVLGASLADGRLDTELLAALVAHSTADGQSMGLTLHRCFDLVPDFPTALEQAIRLGFDRVLTSGGAPSAPQGAARLAELIAQAGDWLVVMPGSGVTAATLPALTGLPLQEIHASCGVAVPQSGPVVSFGFGPALARHTDGAMLRQLRAALDARG